jgi:hypothetical protein
VNARINDNLRRKRRILYLEEDKGDQSAELQNLALIPHTNIKRALNERENYNCVTEGRGR